MTNGDWLIAAVIAIATCFIVEAIVAATRRLQSAVTLLTEMQRYLASMNDRLTEIETHTDNMPKVRDDDSWDDL